jgi:CheY-like chemotaxis protein
VLVVDDVAVDRHKAAAIIAQELGWRVTHADNGQAALEAVERERPDVVLTDLQMPEMDGLALVEALHVRHPFLPVVLMTAHGARRWRSRRSAAGPRVTSRSGRSAPSCRPR